MAWMSVAGDVAEDAAHHDYLGGDSAHAGVGGPGIGLQHLDTVQPRRVRCLPSGRDVALVQFDQPGAHIAPARMPAQNADHVSALPGAQADQPYPSRGSMIELGAQVALHEFEPSL